MVYGRFSESSELGESPLFCLESCAMPWAPWTMGFTIDGFLAGTPTEGERWYRSAWALEGASPLAVCGTALTPLLLVHSDIWLSIFIFFIGMRQCGHTTC
eukprot:GDKK01055795.1.p2 GENE.GDKK01055795.1~~GDKK01055795.1.p2  ORF type:complete len:100 (-),score=0.27 GDKK01055795.1:204-503(-)